MQNVKQTRLEWTDELQYRRISVELANKGHRVGGPSQLFLCSLSKCKSPTVDSRREYIQVLRLISNRFSTSSVEQALVPGVYAVPVELTMFFETLMTELNVIPIVDVGDSFAGEISSRGPKIIISSPNSDKLRRVGELQNPMYVFMPLWSWDEISELNHELPEGSVGLTDQYVRQSDDDLKYLCDVFGGVPRILFKRASVEDKLLEMEKVLQDTEFQFGLAFSAPRTITSSLALFRGF